MLGRSLWDNGTLGSAALDAQVSLRHLLRSPRSLGCGLRPKPLQGHLLLGCSRLQDHLLVHQDLPIQLLLLLGLYPHLVLYLVAKFLLLQRILVVVHLVVELA